jgi:aromatic ring hydroxylase
MARYLDKYLHRANLAGHRRVRLFKLAGDTLGEQFGSRQLHYEKAKK